MWDRLPESPQAVVACMKTGGSPASLSCGLSAMFGPHVVGFASWGRTARPAASVSILSRAPRVASLRKVGGQRLPP
jgi:hypothetical protein